MKTYNERLNEIAEELMECSYNLVAKEDGNNHTYAEFKQVKGGEYMEAKTFLILPLAAIALKHMAEEWKLGYLYAHSDDLTERAGGFKIATNEHLTKIGLIEPQTT